MSNAFINEILSKLFRNPENSNFISWRVDSKSGKIFKIISAIRNRSHNTPGGVQFRVFFRIKNTLSGQRSDFWKWYRVYKCNFTFLTIIWGNKIWKLVNSCRAMGKLRSNRSFVYLIRYFRPKIAYFDISRQKRLPLFFWNVFWFFQLVLLVRLVFNDVYFAKEWRFIVSLIFQCIFVLWTFSHLAASTEFTNGCQVDGSCHLTCASE